MLSATSVQNYHEHRNSGKLGAQAQQILDFLTEHPNQNFSRAEISESTGVRLSSVCGRVSELLEDKLITERPERHCGITGKTITPVRVARGNPKFN